jgi:competence protein ComEA
MNERESRTLMRAAGVLLAAAAVRWVVVGEPPSAGELTYEPSALAALDSAVREAAEEEARASRPLAPDERLDPNRADIVDLRRLPGVGPTTAAAVVASREREGPYASADDLVRVRGIGPATAAKLAPHLDFSAPPPAGTVFGRSPAAPAGPAPVDLNVASVQELEGLPGIGPALAERIVESRRAEGPYRRADDLLRVRGIGPVLLERLRSRVRPGGD